MLKVALFLVCGDIGAIFPGPGVRWGDAGVGQIFSEEILSPTGVKLLGWRQTLGTKVGLKVPLLGSRVPWKSISGLGRAQICTLSWPGGVTVS